jgi:hypothetical protein
VLRPYIIAKSNVGRWRVENKLCAPFLREDLPRETGERCKNFARMGFFFVSTI